MRLDRFDLNLLVIFETVFTEGNLTRAAEQLNVAQPTVSNAMTRLRGVFDDPLFVRAGRGVAPTPLAQRMIGPVRQALRQMQATLDGSVKFEPALAERTFTVSIGEIAAMSLLPPLVEALSAEAPGVKLRAFQANRREIKEMLALGSLDIAVDIPRLSAHALNSTVLSSGDYVCAMRRGHPKARGKLTLEKLLSLDFVAVSSRPKGSSLLELAINRVGGRVEPVLRTQYYLPAMRIVASSDYALLLPRSLADQADLVTRDLPFDVDMEGSALFWHRSVEDDPANRWLRGLVIRTWGELSL